MSNYRRHYVPGGSWFFTVNLQNRQSDLLTCYIDSLRTATLTVKRAKPFTINAWVILPEHCTVSGPCRKATATFRPAGGISKRRSAAASTCAISGSRVSGNTLSVTKRTIGGMWIIFTSIRLSTAMWVKSATGRIQRFIAMWLKGCIRWIGRERSRILQQGSGSKKPGGGYALPGLQKRDPVGPVSEAPPGTKATQSSKNQYPLLTSAASIARNDGSSSASPKVSACNT